MKTSKKETNSDLLKKSSTTHESRLSARSSIVNNNDINREIFHIDQEGKHSEQRVHQYCFVCCHGVIRLHQASFRTKVYVIAFIVCRPSRLSGQTHLQLFYSGSNDSTCSTANHHWGLEMRLLLLVRAGLAHLNVYGAAPAVWPTLASWNDKNHNFQ